jgi:hypothetical protein
VTIEDLRSIISSAAWFSRLGEADIQDGFVRIPSLEAWADGPVQDVALKQIANEMEWLPSSNDQDDPIHGSSLEQLAKASGKKQEISTQVLEIYKMTLAALRSFDGHPCLIVGPHDFTGAARGAALFAARRAAYEVVLREPSFWCRMINVYHGGHWPCGLLPNNQVVVF